MGLLEQQLSLWRLWQLGAPGCYSILLMRLSLHVAPAVGQAARCWLQSSAAKCIWQQQQTLLCRSSETSIAYCTTVESSRPLLAATLCDKLPLLLAADVAAAAWPAAEFVCWGLQGPSS
jgi:hypothetical protein